MKPHQNTDKSLVQNEAKGSTGAGKKSKYYIYYATYIDKNESMIVDLTQGLTSKPNTPEYWAWILR